MQKFLLSFISLFFTTNVFAHGISEEARAAMLEGGYVKYIWLGAEHMLTGYDHLLFLFGVIFFLNTFKEILKFITVFTLGHSITLIFATFMGITANYWLVDAVIALSVCYKGFDNNHGFQNYFGFRKAPNLLLMVFVFGLIHGFGLSTRLQQLPLGHDNTGILMRIISFNVGVEVGQVVALVFMVGFLRYFRHTQFFQRFTKVANDGLMLAGFMLLLMQLHGYLHTSDPHEFGFNKDGHQHHHMEVFREQQRLMQERMQQGHGHDHGHDHDSGGHDHSHGDNEHDHGKHKHDNL